MVLGQRLFDRLGRFAGLDQEMEKIAVESLIDYPGLQVETAIVATAEQLIAVHTGEGVSTHLAHLPHHPALHAALVPALRAARQQHGEISFTPSMRCNIRSRCWRWRCCRSSSWLARRKTLPATIGELAAGVALALLANAFVCGALSNPHDRYGARMVWLAVFEVVLAALAWRRADRLGRPSDLA